MQDDIYHRMYHVEDRHWWFSAKRRIIVSLLHRYTGKGAGQRTPRVADVGCGCGRLLEDLSAPCECVGFDVSETAVEFCRKRGVDARLGKLPDEVPLEEGTFDAVILSDVIEHIDDDRAAARAAGGLLRPGGIMIVTVPAFPALWSSWDDAHGHKRRYTRKNLKGALEATGLGVEFLSYYNTLLFPAAAAVRALKGLMGRSSTAELEPPPRLVNAVLGAVFASERHLLGRIGMPFGLSLIAVLRKR